MEEQNKVKEMLSDKAFISLLLTSFLGIFLCIVCLCTSTFAWFSDSAPSQGNEIKIADDCLLSVTVSLNGNALTDIEDGVQLVAGKTYKVTLSLPGNTASGYCLISAGGNTYYTDYILRHNEPVDQKVTFDLMVEETQTVKFTPRWGIYAAESDVENGALIIPAP